MLQVLDISKTRLNYFVNDAEILQKNGLAKFGMVFATEDIENLNGELEPHKHFLLKFDLIFLAKDSPHKEKDIKDITDEEAAARIKITYEGIIKIHDEENVSEDIINHEIIRILEPYIRKDIKDFTNEVNIPMIPLPINFVGMRLKK